MIKAQAKPQVDERGRERNGRIKTPAESEVREGGREMKEGFVEKITKC